MEQEHAQGGPLSPGGLPLLPYLPYKYNHCHLALLVLCFLLFPPPWCGAQCLCYLAPPCMVSPRSMCHLRTSYPYNTISQLR